MVVVLVVLAAAWGGSWEIEPRDLDLAWLDWLQLPTAEPLQGTLPEPVAGADAIDASGDGGWLGAALGVAVRVAGALVALALVAWLVRGLWRWFRYRDAPRRRAEPASGAVGVRADEPDLPVLRRGVAEARRFLADVDRPVDAVVAAWLALEEAAGSSGVHRSPAQTPTEFTVAVLERTSADAGTTAELLALYHRARFSRQPIGPDDVARASRCLERLAADWDAVPQGDGAGR